MVFSTYLFIYYFLPLMLAVYFGLAWIAALAGVSPASVSWIRNAVLLVASYVFYGWWNPWFILLMMTITLVNYGCAWRMSRPSASARQRFQAVTVAVVFSLGSLGVFKYLMFFQTNLNWVLVWWGADALGVIRIVLPVGISFYTFQALSYSIDVYRGTAPPARSLIDFAAYIALYPQLIAGPIVRYHTVSEQLVDRSHTWDKFASGAALFILGLGKKVLLADPMGGVADAAFGAASLTAGDAWFGAVAYAMQIYFDFCGYSDMAVGLGRMIGFEFPKNFDAPYQSDSITDFWRRWHVSLSSFLRDYLYVPLGGNRRGPTRTYVNLLIVMLLGGLWHGAAWTYVAWGLYHGVLLALERAAGKSPIYRFLPRPVRVGTTFVLVLFSWVLFRSVDVPAAVGYLSAMAGSATGVECGFLVAAELYTPTAFAVMATCWLLVFAPVQGHCWTRNITWPKVAIVLPVFGLSLLMMFTQSFSPFLYFQF
ncbi:MAG: MBOAT family protein [Pirellulaceae bacterium]|nr:MBOAT family protein [Pirellulaceae bacterium]